jgi:hypothetical protein
VDVPKKQIQPRISTEMYQRLSIECEVKQCTSGEVVEAALREYLLPPTEEGKLDGILRRLTDIETVLARIVTALELLGAEQSNPVTADDTISPLPIATHEQMYGPISPARPPEAPTRATEPPPRKRWPWRG